MFSKIALSPCFFDSFRINTDLEDTGLMQFLDELTDLPTDHASPQGHKTGCIYITNPAPSASLGSTLCETSHFYSVIVPVMYRRMRPGV